jgi:hypothetical protein
MLADQFAHVERDVAVVFDGVMAFGFGISRPFGSLWPAIARCHYVLGSLFRAPLLL